MNGWIPNCLGPWMPDRNVCVGRIWRCVWIAFTDFQFTFLFFLFGSAIQFWFNFVFRRKCWRKWKAPAVSLVWRLSIRNGHAKIDLIESTEPTVERFYWKWAHTGISIVVCTFIFPFFWYWFSATCQFYTTPWTYAAAWIVSEPCVLWHLRHPNILRCIRINRTSIHRCLCICWPDPTFNVVAVVDAPP